MRGAWIEIPVGLYQHLRHTSLPVRGAWIEILPTQTECGGGQCRSPCGERGLKFRCGDSGTRGLWSLPVRGAWIEMAFRAECGQRQSSLPVRGAWIEIVLFGLTLRRSASLPVRGAWIEMIFR